MAIHRISGVCPKETSALFNSLTVLENLKIFCKIKGSWKEGPSFPIMKVAEDFGLTKILHTEVCVLSASDKRMVQVALAFSGDNKVLFFEEPTTNMDPYGKMRVWNLINSNANGKTIVVSTCSMEEAEMIGDRIAIFVEGRMKCCGSVSFLKNLFGTGYYLKIDKDIYCRRDRIKHVVRHFIKQGDLHEDTTTHITFLLPLHTTHMFYKLFTHLENRKQELGIASFNVDASTLEEAFLSITEADVYDIMQSEKDSDVEDEESDLFIKPIIRSRGKKLANSTFKTEPNVAKVGSAVDPVEEQESVSALDQETNTNYYENDKDHADSDLSSKLSSLLESDSPRYQGCTLACMQMYALLKKKLIISSRSFHVEAFQALLVVIAGWWLQLGGSPEAPRRRVLKMDNYFTTTAPWSYVFSAFDESNTSKELSDFYLSYLGETAPSVIKYDTSEMSILDIVRHFIRRFIFPPFGAQFTAENSSSLSAVALYSQEESRLDIAGSVIAVMNTFLHYLTKNGNLQMHAGLLHRDFDITDDSKISLNSYVLEAESYTYHIGFLMASTFMMVPYYNVMERKSGAKHLQYLSGAKPWMYWLANFVFDYANYFFLCNIFLAVVKHLELPLFQYSLDNFSILLALNGVMMHLHIYAAQFLFNSPSLSLVVFLLLNYLSSELHNIQDLIQNEQLMQISETLLFLVPGNLLPSSAGLLVLNYRYKQICEMGGKNCSAEIDPTAYELCCSVVCSESKLFCYGYRKDPLSMHRPGVGCFLVAMVIHTCVWFVLLVVFECEVLPRV